MDIKALGYICIESTDIEQWRHYATQVVGMVVAPSMPDSGDLFLKMDEYSWRLRIINSDKNRLSVAGWELASKADFDQALSELQASGIDYKRGDEQQCAERRVKEFVQLQDPAGGTIELFYYMQLDYQRLNSCTGNNHFVTGYHGDMGLGHYVIPTNNFDATVEFYTQVLGFGETDYMHFNFSDQPDDPGQGLHFLHVNNPRHHSLAIFNDPNPPESACVHLMFEVENIHEVGYFIDRCKQHEVKIVSSLGCHTNDLMISVYAACPAGFAIEYGCDGVQLDWTDYKPTHSAVPSLWGHDWIV